MLLLPIFLHYTVPLVCNSLEDTKQVSSMVPTPLRNFLYSWEREDIHRS